MTGKTTNEAIRKEAQSLLVEHGVHFSFEELRRRVQGGSGGVRHHFATKEVLIADFAHIEFEDMLTLELRGFEHREAGDALESWVTQLAAWLTYTLGRSDLMLKAYKKELSPLHPVVTGIVASTTPHVERARRSGVLHQDVTVDDVVVAILSAGAAADGIMGGPAPETFDERGRLARKCMRRSLTGLRVDRSARPD